LQNGGFGKYVGIRGVSPIEQSRFTVEIWGSGRVLLGNKNKCQGWGEKEQVLARCDVSTLVIDSLCGRARGQNGAVACFYFYFAGCRTRPDGRSGEVLDELEREPDEISRDAEFCSSMKHF